MNLAKRYNPKKFTCAFAILALAGISTQPFSQTAVAADTVKRERRATPMPPFVMDSIWNALYKDIVIPKHKKITEPRPDADGDGVPDEWDLGPNTPKGIKVDSHGCAVTTLNINNYGKPGTQLPDTDGDGVTDQFDLEPNTPAGAEVDTHGRAIDTDGDGVPDYKDKEKLTQQICFPVNDNGVGSCPEPDCCRYRPSHPRLGSHVNIDCRLNALPIIKFKAGNAILNKKAAAMLDSITQLMSANPNCNVKVKGYVSDATSYHQHQISWDKVYITIKYLIGKGIKNDRLIFSYENVGDPGIINFESTTDHGPDMIPAPHPMYSTLKPFPANY